MVDADLNNRTKRILKMIESLEGIIERSTSDVGVLAAMELAFSGMPIEETMIAMLILMARKSKEAQSERNDLSDSD